jgi:hypothetical protein
MATQVRILVGEDYVGDFYIKENSREYWQKYANAAKENPTLVLIDKDSQTIPVEGMIYQNGSFVSSELNENFIANNIAEDFQRFALVVNNIYAASHDVSISSMQNVIAAYQSNPTFVVNTVEITPEGFHE